MLLTYRFAYQVVNTGIGMNRDVGESSVDAVWTSLRGEGKKITNICS
jgi:hypothetical protein